MKRVISMFLVFVILNIGGLGCFPDVLAADVHITLDKVCIENENKYYGVIKAFSNNQLMWEYTTETAMQAEVETISDAYQNGNAVYIVVMNVLYAIDLNSGKLKWKVNNVGGGNSFAFDKYGNVYVSAFRGPDVVVVNSDGVELYRESNYNSSVYDLETKDDMIYMYYEYYGENDIVDAVKTLSTSQFAPAENNDREITGVLYERIYKDKFGNSDPYLILRVENSDDAILRDSSGTEFKVSAGDEIQVIAKNYSPEMTGARVKIKSYEDVFEAHSSYHMRPVVVLNAEIEILQKPINVLLDGEKVEFDYPPVIINGRTMVPLRAIFEAMGATVEWNQETKTATGYGKFGYNVVVSEGSDIAYVSGFPYKLDLPVKNVNGRLLAPARFVAEAFGGFVVWEEQTKTVRIQSMSANVSDNRSYNEINGYSTCYEAAMTHGRLVYIADGYKAIVLRSGYIDKVDGKYKFVNDIVVADQRYYFNSDNVLVTDYELAERLDFIYNVNNEDYESRSEYWTKKVNIADEMTALKQSYSNAVDLLEKGASYLETGYVLYDVGKTVFDQMVVGVMYPKYGVAKMKDIPADIAKTTTRMTFGGIILSGLLNSKDTFNGYCDTITEIYSKYGYGYITNLDDAERYIRAVAGQYLLVKNAEAVSAYLKATYPEKTILDVAGDFSYGLLKGFVGKWELDGLIKEGSKTKKVYDFTEELATYLEGMNVEGNVVIGKSGTDAFLGAQNIIKRLYTFDSDNYKYIELIKK